MLSHAAEYAHNPGVILNIEGAAYEETALLERLLSFTSKDEQAANKKYESCNPEWVPKTTDAGALFRLMGNVAVHPLVHYRLGRAFTRGTTVSQILDGLKVLDVQSRDVNAHFINGDGGTVSSSAANAAAAQKILAATVAQESQVRHTIWHGEYHGFCNDLGRYVMEVGRLLK